MWRMPVSLSDMDAKTAPAIRELYPQLTGEELVEVEDRLERYLAVVLRIFERIESDTNSRACQLAPGTGTLCCECQGRHCESKDEPQA